MFWNNWKNISEQERKAINVITAAQKLILSHIPRDKIVSIYIGGSFLRREMTPTSDIDMWVITTDTRGQKLVSKLITEAQGKFTPELGLSGYSLWELKNGKSLAYLVKKHRTGPKRFTKKLANYQLIYGKQLNPATFPTQTDKEDLTMMISVFETKFLPLYNENILAFQDILKQVFWLADLELSLKGHHPPHSWTEMVKLTPKNHIARTALDLRHSKPSLRQETTFISQLKKYLEELKTL